MSPTRLNPRDGYDAAAPFMEGWSWAKLWDRNEAPFIREWLGRGKGRTVLNAGCGLGGYSMWLRHVGFDVVDLDLSLEVLKIRRAQDASAATVQADVTSLPFAASTFDVVLCARVLTHLSHPASALQEMGRVTRNEGLCILTDIHSEHPYDCTALTTSKGKVRIETYKHTIAELIGAIAAVPQLHVVSLREHRLTDLREKPDPVEFSKLYSHPDRYVFWSCLLSAAT